MPFTLTHLDTDREIEVEADQVPLYLQQGWQTKPNATPPEDPDPGPEVTVLADTPPAKPKKK